VVGVGGGLPSGLQKCPVRNKGVRKRSALGDMTWPWVWSLLHVVSPRWLFLRTLRLGWQGGSAGVTIVKTDKAIIIGTYGEGQTAGQCSSVVGKLGDYLKGVGY